MRFLHIQHMEKKYNFVYHTKNLINGKSYIGVHSTNKLDDGYIGCGIKSANQGIKKEKGLPQAIKKYGYHNFKREILCFFDTEAEAYLEEGFLADIEWVKRKDTYNLIVGGTKPPVLDKINYPRTAEWIQKIAEANTGRKASPETIVKLRNSHLGKKQSQETIDKRVRRGEDHYRFGKSPSEECKSKISKTLSNKYIGEKSYMYISDIYQIDLSTKTHVGTYKTGAQASLHTGLLNSKINKILKGEARHTKNFFFTRNLENWEQEYFDIDNKLKQGDKRGDRGIPVECYDLNGNLINVFLSLNEAVKYFNKGRSSGKDIHRSATTTNKNGTTPTCWGHIWKYA